MPNTKETTTREPRPEEMFRVAHLFRNQALRRESRVVVTVRSHPIERFVAAAAWWPDGAVARFQVACQPGVPRAEIAAPLLEGLAQAAQSAGMATLENSDLVREEDEWGGLLQSHGFERMRTERFFELAYPDVWNRVTRMHEKYHQHIPPTWHTDPIAQHPPEKILDLVAPHRLMPPAEICRLWQPNVPSGFDRELSCILFDGTRPFGTFLVRRRANLAYIEVQVVHEPNPRLRSLADLCVIYHGVRITPRDGEIQRVQFRSGETEHRQTANVALRMGGREISRRHVFARNLRAG